MTRPLPDRKSIRHLQRRPKSRATPDAGNASQRVRNARIPDGSEKCPTPFRPCRYLFPIHSGQLGRIGNCRYVAPARERGGTFVAHRQSSCQLGWRGPSFCVQRGSGRERQSRWLRSIAAMARRDAGEYRESVGPTSRVALEPRMGPEPHPRRSYPYHDIA